MSLLDRFRKKVMPNPRQQDAFVSPKKADFDADLSLREEVTSLYDRRVNPLHAVKAMLYETDGNLTTNAKRVSGIYLGVNDLLDRDGIDADLRSQLVSVRDSLAKSIEDVGPEARIFVSNYRESTRHINEMKLLQSYKTRLLDANGIMQFEAFCNMLTEIEYDRANTHGSLAQDVSKEALAKLYDLRDNWDDPSKLK